MSILYRIIVKIIYAVEKDAHMSNVSVLFSFSFYGLSLRYVDL